MSPTLTGGQDPSASTGSGATAASPSAALLSGLLADAYGIPAAAAVVAGLTAASGVIVAVRMRSTDHRAPG
jgi:hypothetical protein